MKLKYRHPSLGRRLRHWAPYVLLAAAYTALRYAGYGLLAILVLVGGIVVLGAKGLTPTPRWGDIEDRRRARLHDAIEHPAGEDTGSAGR